MERKDRGKEVIYKKKKKNDILILPFYKHKKVVIMNKLEYNTKMPALVHDTNEYVLMTKDLTSALKTKNNALGKNLLFNS